MLQSRWTILLLIALLLTASACQPAETTPAESESAAASTAEDLAALRELVSRYDDYANSGDLDGLAELFTENAVRMAPDAPPVLGRDAIRAQSEEFEAEFEGDLNATVEDVRVAGDVGFLRIHYTDTLTPRDGGEPESFTGKWILVCARQADGSWQITDEMWTEYTP